MIDMKNLRIAWIYPSIYRGNYWYPIISEFIKSFRLTKFYTGCLWKGFDSSQPNASVFEIVGKSKFLKSFSVAEGYSRGFIYASPKIIFSLLKFRPHIILASAFSIWTLLALLFKPLGWWKVIIIYDGSSLNTDFKDSKLRLLLRTIMAHLTDAFISNSQSGVRYLHEDLGIPKSKIYQETYLVPDYNSLAQKIDTNTLSLKPMKHPVFLFVGQLIDRKGLQKLLDACQLLERQTNSVYTLLIIGDGPERAKFEAIAEGFDLSNHIVWVGWVDYGNLGAYFQSADILVFPSFEDVWGMVVLEAMVFGMPIICSKEANASEMVEPGKNGYVFDPQDADELANIMYSFIEEPALIKKMGEHSKKFIAEHTPEAVAQSLAKAIREVAG